MKNRFHLRTAAIISCLVLFSAVVLGQGLYWESVTSGIPKSKKDRNSKSYYMPKVFKLTSDEHSDIIIVRLDREKIYTVDAGKKEYSEMTFAEMEQAMKDVGGKMDAAMKQMRERVKNMPEEQRKMVEQMMGGKLDTASGSDAKVTLDNSGEKKTISGFACTKFVVKRDGKEFLTLWATKDIPGYEGMRSDLRSFSQRMAAMMPMNGKDIAAAMKQVDGFPIQTEISEVITTVKKIEKRSTPASEFEVPSGYKKVDSPMKKMK